MKGYGGRLNLNKNKMIDTGQFNHLKFTTENITTAAQFVAKVNAVDVELNTAWAAIKAGIPAGQQAAGEAAVRAVLAA